MRDTWGSILFGFLFCLGSIFFLSGLADLSIVLNGDIWTFNFTNALQIIGNGAIKIFSGIVLIVFVFAPGGFFMKYRWRLRFLMRDIIRYCLDAIRNDT